MFADFADKWVHYYILGVLISYYDGFLPFWGLLWNQKKNWSFRWPRTCRIMSVLDISHFCRPCSQMSELLHFRCPDVILWWFPGIFWAFEKIKKIEVFDHRAPAEKCDFFYFSQFCIFCSQMSELLRFRCSDVILCGFPAILRPLKK